MNSKVLAFSVFEENYYRRGMGGGYTCTGTRGQILKRERENRGRTRELKIEKMRRLREFYQHYLSEFCVKVLVEVL